MHDLEEMMDRTDLARILRKSPITIRNMTTKSPEKLPPFLRVGNEARWLPSDVKAWIEEQKAAPKSVIKQTKRRPGRPSKSETVAARRAGAGE
ncbi:MAG: hypothetical protein ABIK45_06595 [Pseudomonadota bacterium]